MQKHTKCRNKTLKVTGIENIPAPDADERLSRAIDILFKAAARGTTKSEDSIKGKKGPAGDGLTNGEEAGGLG